MKSFKKFITAILICAVSATALAFAACSNKDENTQHTNHTPATGWEQSTTEHWHKCAEGGEEISGTRASHRDENHDGKCDDCNYTLSGGQQGETQSDLVFEYIGANGYSVKAKDSSISGKIIIPDYYDDGTHGRKKVYDIENFNNCTNLTEVEVQGNSLWGISDKAFEGCKNLNKIILPDSLRRIGDEAFSGCTSLTEITLPIGISELGFTRSPFYDFADRGFTIIYKGTKSEWNKKTGRLLVPAFVTIVYLGDN